MKINLTEIAAAIGGRGKDVKLDLGDGKIVKFHLRPIPETIIWTYRPLWRPADQPTVTMLTQGGIRQERAVKAGDPGFAEWQAEQDRYDRETSEIRLAARYVLPFGDQIDWPDLSQPPEYLAAQGDRYPGSSPDDVLRKYFWLGATLLAKTTNLIEFQQAIGELQGAETPDAGDVDEAKKNSASITSGDE